MGLRWDFLLFFVFFPVSFTFLPVVIVYFFMNFVGVEERVMKYRMLFYLLAIVVSPVFFGAFILAVPILVLFASFKILSTRWMENVFWYFIAFIFCIVTLVLGSVLVYFVVIGLFVCLPIVGLALLVLKLVNMTFIRQ